MATVRSHGSIIAGRVLSNRMRLMYANSWSGILFCIVMSFVFPMILWDHVAQHQLITWSLVNIGICMISSVFMIIHHKKGAVFRNRNVNIFLNKAWMFLVGAVVGAPGLFLMPADSFTHQIFIILVFAGIVTASVASLSQVFTNFFFFTLPIFLQLTIRLFMMGEKIYITISILSIIFYIIMIISAMIMNHMMKDKAKLKITEAALQKSEEKYRSLVENLNDIVYALDTEARITYISPNIEQISGYRQSEMIGELFTKFVYREDLDSRIGRFKKVLEGAQEASEYRFVTRDGRKIWVRTSARQILQNGEVRGIQGVLVDITDLKNTEEALIRARDEAEKATRVRTRFLATMSHEIRTPLSAVAGMINLSIMTEDREKLLDYLETVKVATDHLMNVINNLLDFSRMEAGCVVLESNDFNLHSSIEAVINTFRFRAEEKDIDLHLSMADGIKHFVNGDEARFRQVLYNLIGNAIKFTSKGSIIVSVSEITPDSAGITMPENGSLVKISIADTGIGIPEDKIDAVFKSFVQADTSTGRKYGGTGLGLAICRELISLMGGRIDVESSVGVGSTFSFVMPFLKAMEDPDNKPYSMADISPEDNNQALDILLAEDNALNAKLTSEVLLKKGHRVSHAKNGLEVIELLAAESYDCIIMDIEMPFLDGYETAEAIRLGSAGNDIRDIPIIAMTAHPFEDIRERCRELGINTCLGKPVNIQEIDAIISNAILSPSTTGKA